MLLSGMGERGFDLVRASPGIRGSLVRISAEITVFCEPVVLSHWSFTLLTNPQPHSLGCGDPLCELVGPSLAERNGWPTGL